MQSSPKNKKNIAICHVQVPFIRGGAEVLVTELKKQLEKQGHNVDIISIPFKWYPAEKIIESSLLWRMADIDVSEALGKPIDLVICTKFPSYLIKHPNKILWLFHQYRQAYELDNTEFKDDFSSEENKAIRDLIIEMDNKFIPEAKKIFTISKNVSNRLKKYNNINSTHIYPPLKNAGEYYCNDFKKYILFVSRISTIKRQEMLIRSIKYIKDKSINFIFVGKDEAWYLKELKRIIKDEGVEDRIEFKCNYIPDKELLDLYANALAVAFFPYDEDYGYVTLEAFFSKKPVITCSDSGGVLEFVEHGKNGFIVKPNDHKKIAAHIDELSENQELAKKLGNEGYESIKHINWNKAINQILDETT